MNTIDGIIEDLELEDSCVGGCTTKGEIIACLENLKILQKERKHGEWIHKCISGDRFCECSVCRSQTYQISQLYEFCPHCGADMRGEKNENM